MQCLGAPRWLAGTKGSTSTREPWDRALPNLRLHSVSTWPVLLIINKFAKCARHKFALKKKAFL